MRRKKGEVNERYAVRVAAVSDEELFVREGAMSAKSVGERPPKDVLVEGECRLLNDGMWRFVHEYMRDRDPVRAAAAAGYKNARKALSKLKNNPLVREKLAEIDEAWSKSLSLNAQNAAAKHMELVEKLNADYDSFTGDERRLKAAMAGALVKASEVSLKATGHFDKETTGKGTSFVINMDFGGGQTLKIGGKEEIKPQEAEKLVVIEGEVVTDGG
jgi:hypothetical protein